MNFRVVRPDMPEPLEWLFSRSAAHLDDVAAIRQLLTKTLRAPVRPTEAANTPSVNSDNSCFS